MTERGASSNANSYLDVSPSFFVKRTVKKAVRFDFCVKKAVSDHPPERFFSKESSQNVLTAVALRVIMIRAESQRTARSQLGIRKL